MEASLSRCESASSVVVIHGLGCPHEYVGSSWKEGSNLRAPTLAVEAQVCILELLLQFPVDLKFSK